MITLDVGAGSVVRGTVAMDSRPPSTPTGVPYFIHDGTVAPWPFADGSVGDVVSHHSLEHVPLPPKGTEDPIYVWFDEAHRVLRRGGTLRVEVPHFQSPGAWGNVDHRRAFAPDWFSFLSDPTRVPWRPRRLWEIVSVEVTRSFPGWFGIRERLPRVYALACRVRLGRPQNVVAILRKT